MQVERWRADIVPHPAEAVRRYRAAGYWSGRTIGEQFHRTALAHPEAPAVITATSRHSYREVDERTDAIAAGLIECGLRPGEAVLLQLGNSLGTVLTWYGLIKAGLVPVATLPAHRGHEIGEIGGLTEAAAHVVAADLPKGDLVEFALRMAREAGGSRTVLTVGAASAAPGTVRIEDLGADVAPAIARAAVERVAAVTDGDDVAVFQLSGGTTSTPKVIPRLHDDYWFNAAAYAARLGWDESVRVVHVLPVIHNAGIVCALHAAHSVGAAFVVADHRPESLLPLMAAAGTTDVMAYPALVAEWSRHPGFDAAVASLQRIVLTGTRVDDESFALFEDRGVRVLGLFGAGEGLITVTAPDAPAAVRQHSIGTPVSDLDVVRVLVPGSEEPAPDGTTGELCFAGPYTLRGYLRSPERNAEAFTSDGLYRSGDLVTRRPLAGVASLVFEGRAKDLIVRGGEKVNAAEVEALVLGMPGIDRAALIPVPDSRLGERGCLCVQLAEGAPAITLADVVDHLRARDVAKYKWPERLEIFAELPLTQVGKLDKRALVTSIVGQPPARVGAP